MSMPQNNLSGDVAAKAKQLLARRSAAQGLWFYLQRDWRRQVLFLVAYTAIPMALWFLNSTMLAAAVACFFAGSKFRDLRWYVALAKEWPTTTQFIDWNKVEELAENQPA